MVVIIIAQFLKGILDTIIFLGTLVLTEQMQEMTGVCSEEPFCSKKIMPRGNGSLPHPVGYGNEETPATSLKVR